MSTPPPDVLKYFYEEPALLEPLSSDANPDARRTQERTALSDTPSVPLSELLDTRDAYRGYLAGTNRAVDQVGLTTLRRPEVFVEPIVAALGRAWWGRCTPQATVDTLQESDVRRVLQAPTNTALVVTADGPVDAERITAAAGRERRRTVEALQALLDGGAVAFFPEPAHDGHDWSFFSRAPMRERLVSAFREQPADDTRRFVVPYQEARSESKFYFESWQLTESPLPEYIEEV